MRAVALASGADHDVEGYTQRAGQGEAGVIGKSRIQPFGVRGLCRRSLDRRRFGVVSQSLEDAVQPEASPQIYESRNIGRRGRKKQHGRQGRFGVDGGRTAAEQTQGGQAETSGGYWLC